MADDNDWIFDYVLQFLESDKFDAAVMDFVDEKCYVFDNDEENKFIYTDIYHEFLDHMETIISSNLAQLDISTDTFYEACQTSRSNRDINRRVFEKIVAMEDFTVFKKIMVKRNMELQYEAMMSYKAFAELGSDLGELSGLPDPDELEAMLDTKNELQEREDEKDDTMEKTAEQLEAIYRESLLELEMIHKQEEMEQLELEQALAMSLIAEEERLRRARIEAKNAPDDDEEEVTMENQSSADAKATRTSTTSKHSSKPSPAPHSDEPKQEFADPKPLRTTGGSSSLSPMKALPPISKGPKPDLVELNAQYQGKRKQAEDAFRRNQAHLAQKRQQQDEITKDIPVASAEAERRAKYMAEQRDRLIALKKKEREEKVRLEEERQAKLQDENRKRATAERSSELDSKGSCSDEADAQEQQRSIMRMALARRMKQSLLESEEQRLMQQHEDQFSMLDKKLQEVERQRQENQQRDLLLQENLRKQQAQMARNVQRSAAQMRHQDR